MAVFGPDFKTGFVDALPVSNADWGRTVAALLGLKPADHGKLIGRVVTEAMNGGTIPKAEVRIRRSAPASNGLVTELRAQYVGSASYYTVAGFKGRTVGL
jgi:hypothetical protein